MAFPKTLLAYLPEKRLRWRGITAAVAHLAANSPGTPIPHFPAFYSSQKYSRRN
jgi:hypothetical protein